MTKTFFPDDAKEIGNSVLEVAEAAIVLLVACCGDDGRRPAIFCMGGRRFGGTAARARSRFQISDIEPAVLNTHLCNERATLYDISNDQVSRFQRIRDINICMYISLKCHARTPCINFSLVCIAMAD